jgi:hypothetical protein
MTEISVIIPADDYEENLITIIKNLYNVITHNNLYVETLIICKSKNTSMIDLAMKLSAQHPSLHIRVLSEKLLSGNFGSVIRFGLAFSQAKYCVIIEPDGSFPVQLIPNFISHLRNGSQLVQCTRYLLPKNKNKILFKYRFSQFVYRFFIRIFLGFSISDSTFGFRAFDRIYIQALGISSVGYSIFPEMTFKVILSGGKVEYISGMLNQKDNIRLSGFKLRNEVYGYIFVLIKAFLHKTKLSNWF